MIERSFDEVINVLGKTRDLHTKTIEQIASSMISCYKQGGKVIIFGNGGSYSDAMHFAGELEGAYKNRKRAALAALVPSNTAALTAIANDFGYDHVFRRFVEANGQAGDIVIGLTTSGNSPNVIYGLQEAKKRNAYTVAFTGDSGGKVKEYADILFNVPSSDTARIQEMHHFAYHEICGIVENALFPG